MEYLIWDIIIPTLISMLAISYPVARISDFLRENREQQTKIEREKLYGNRKLYVIQKCDSFLA